MKTTSKILGALLLVFAGPLMKVAAFAETPEEALVEMAMATHPATVEKHLPESVREALRQLTPSERSAAERQFMLAPSMLTRDGELIVPEDGHALLVMQAKDTAQAYDIRVEREINNGSDAMIELALGQPENVSQTVFIWMNLEANEWRVTRIEIPRGSERLAIEGPEFVQRFRSKTRVETDDEVMSVIIQVRTALNQYASTYPEMGFPVDLSLLVASSGEVNTDGADGNAGPPAGFLSQHMASNEFTRGEYIYRYHLVTGGVDGDFVMIARPAERGRVNVRSYFVDASGILRFTNEDREPTAQDRPVQ